MATIDISYAKKRYPGMTEEEMAAAMAEENGYVVVVRYKLRPGKPYECFGVCWTYEEADGYLRAPHLTDVEVIYDRRQAERDPPKVIHSAQKISRSIVFGELGQASEPCCWNCSHFTFTISGLYLCCKDEAGRGNVQVHRSDWCSFWKEHTKNIDACNTTRISTVELVADEKDALNMDKSETRTRYNKYGERTGMSPEEFKKLRAHHSNTSESNISPSEEAESLDEFNEEPFLFTSEQNVSKEIQQAQAMATKECWPCALWWSARALENDPSANRNLFIKALIETSKIWATICAELGEKTRYSSKLLERGNMTPEEAKIVADWMICTFYLDDIRDEHASFFQRLNSGELEQATQLLKSDLESARSLALDMIDGILPAELTWNSITSSDTDKDLASAFTAQREALEITLQVSSAADWKTACKQLYQLFKQTESELANQFKYIAEFQWQDSGVVKERHDFGVKFAKGATLFLKCRKRTRKL